MKLKCESDRTVVIEMTQRDFNNIWAAMSYIRSEYDAFDRYRLDFDEIEAARIAGELDRIGLDEIRK